MSSFNYDSRTFELKIKQNVKTIRKSAEIILKSHHRKLQKTSSPFNSLHARIVLYANVDAQCDKTG